MDRREFVRVVGAAMAAAPLVAQASNLPVVRVFFEVNLIEFTCENESMLTAIFEAYIAERKIHRIATFEQRVVASLNEAIASDKIMPYRIVRDDPWRKTRLGSSDESAVGGFFSLTAEQFDIYPLLKKRLDGAITFEAEYSSTIKAVLNGGFA